LNRHLDRAATQGGGIRAHGVPWHAVSPDAGILSTATRGDRVGLGRLRYRHPRGGTLYLDGHRSIWNHRPRPDNGSPTHPLQNAAFCTQAQPSLRTRTMLGPAHPVGKKPNLAPNWPRLAPAVTPGRVFLCFQRQMAPFVEKSPLQSLSVSILAASTGKHRKNAAPIGMAALIMAARFRLGRWGGGWEQGFFPRTFFFALLVVSPAQHFFPRRIGVAIGVGGSAKKCPRCHRPSSSALRCSSSVAKAERTAGLAVISNLRCQARGQMPPCQPPGFVAEGGPPRCAANMRCSHPRRSVRRVHFFSGAGSPGPMAARAPKERR